MSDYINVDIHTRSGRQLLTVRLPVSASVQDLQSAIYDESDRKRKYHPTRQRLTLPPKAEQRSGTALQSRQPLAEYSIGDGSVVQLKDLGQQISYMLVFFLEYAGPLFIYPFFWSRDGRQLLHGALSEKYERSVTQDLAFFYWSVHYSKRIYETFHVHKFSHATMPIFNLFKNCSYYWLFAAFVSYFINHPLYTPPPLPWTVGCICAAYFCQLGNLLCHLILARLRKQAPPDTYAIPRGFLFEYVTCANYTFEIWGWVLFAAATQSLPAAIFGFCGAAQMVQWAVAKHTRLRRLYDGKDGREKYPRRWIILPPFL